MHIAFDERQTIDYGEIWDVEFTEAENTLKEAKSFIKAIETYFEER